MCEEIRREPADHDFQRKEDARDRRVEGGGSGTRDTTGNECTHALVRKAQPLPKLGTCNSTKLNARGPGTG